MRKDDGNLLAVGRDAFIGDRRFTAQHVDASDTWTLVINGVGVADAGRYECQVPGQPTISRVVTLRVLGPFHFPKKKRLKSC